MQINIITCQRILNISILDSLYNAFIRLYANYAVHLTCIYFSANDKEEVSNRSLSPQIRIISEESFFGASLYIKIVSFKSIYESVHNHSFGWFVQQLIKLYSPQFFGHDILIFDSDTLPMKKLRTFISPEVLPVYYERNSRYSPLCAEIFGFPGSLFTKYIAQHMYFSQKNITQLAKQVNNHSLSLYDNWIINLTAICSSSSVLVLSEYELYAFCLNYSLECAFVTQKVRLIRHGTVIEACLGKRFALLIYKLLRIDLVAYESWSKRIHLLEPFKYVFN